MMREPDYPNRFWMTVLAVIVCARTTYPETSLQERAVQVLDAALRLYMGPVSDQVESERIHKLTNIETSYPFGSPDGTRIVYQSDRVRDNSEIYIMNIDDSRVTRLTRDEPGGHFTKPIFSPNGPKIICTRTKDGNVAVFLIDLTR